MVHLMICDVRVKTTIPVWLTIKEKFQIDLFCYHDWIYDTWDVIANSITSFNFIIIEKSTELLLCCLGLLLGIMLFRFIVGYYVV